MADTRSTVTAADNAFKYYKCIYDTWYLTTFTLLKLSSRQCIGMSYTLTIKVCVCDLPNSRLPAKYILYTTDIYCILSTLVSTCLVIQPRRFGDKRDITNVLKRSLFVLPCCFLLVQMRQTTATTQPMKKMTETTPSAMIMYRKMPASVTKHI